MEVGRVSLSSDSQEDQMCFSCFHPNKSSVLGGGGSGMEELVRPVHRGREVGGYLRRDLSFSEGILELHS